MINKPFRFLKNLMRWYQKESDNVLTQIKEKLITPSLWKAAEKNFNERGLPVPIYENHNEEKVVGRVNKIEARDDGLYVTEHELNERGIMLVESGEYPLPSGDFVVHYDDKGTILDLEVFGVSLVNNEGAKNVELVTMSKGKKMPLDKIIIKKIKQKKTEEKKNMDKEELYAFLLEDDVIKNLPDDIVAKIAKEKKDVIEKIIGSSDSDEEVTQEKLAEEEGEEEVKEDEATMNKSEEVLSLLKNAGISKEKIQAILQKFKALLGAESMSKEGEEDTEEMNKDEEKDTEMNKAKQSKIYTLKARMGKLSDAIAKKEYEEGSKVVPTSLKRAENFVRKNYEDLNSETLIKLALDQCSFYGGITTEKVAMKKSGAKTFNEIFFDAAKEGVR